MVWVDGLAKKPSFLLRPGQEIRILIENPKKELPPFNFLVKIIHEDEDILVVDKPKGLVVHPPQAGYDKTMVNALIWMGKDLWAGKDLGAGSKPAPTLRPGVVHRLDKETSGVMVLAKNEQSFQNLTEQFKQRKVKKEYRAITWGQIKKDKISLNLPLARDKRNRLKMKVSFLQAKEAFSEVEVIQRLAKATYLKVFPRTGRMHQIRVHLKFLGFPIVGDKKYGLRDNYKQLFLHAHRLGFFHPSSVVFSEFISPLPEYFKEFIEEHKF